MVAPGRTHHRAGQRFILKPLAALEILLGRGLKLAQIFPRVLEIAVYPLIRDLIIFRPRGIDNFAH